MNRKWVLCLLVLFFLVSCTDYPQVVTPGKEGGAQLQGTQSASVAPKEVRVNMKAFQWGFDPNEITVNKGDTVILEFEEVTFDRDTSFTAHSFLLGAPYNIHQVLEKGQTYTVEFEADTAGEFPFMCDTFCGEGHGTMNGKLVVKDSNKKVEGGKTVEIDMVAYQFGFDPPLIEVNEGDTVKINMVEVTSDLEPSFLLHTFAIGPPYDISHLLEAGKTYEFEFDAHTPGEFAFECGIFCGTDHATMKGQLVVHPQKEDEIILVANDFYDRGIINSTLNVMNPEEDLPSEPINWNVEDYMYLMGVIQTEFIGGAIRILDTKNMVSLGDVEKVGNRIHVMEFHPNKRWLYSISRDGFLSKIDLYSQKIVRQIRVGTDARGIALSENGKYVMVGNYVPNTAVIVNAETLRPEIVIEAFGVDPDGVAVRSRVANVFGVEYRELFAINLKEAGIVWMIDQHPPFKIVKEVRSGRVLHELNALTTDEALLAVTSQEDAAYDIIDMDTLEVIDRIPAPNTPHPGQGTTDFDHKLWYGNSVKEAKVTVIDTENLKLHGYVWPKDVDTAKGGGLFSTPITPNPEDVDYFLFDLLFGEHQGILYVVDRHMVAEGKLGDEPIVAQFSWEDFGYEKKGRLVHPEYTYRGEHIVIGGWDFNEIIVIDAKALPELKVVKTFDAVTPTGIFPAWRFDALYLG